MTLLSRYEAGDFEVVWQEIRSHPRLDGEFRAEVLEVAEAAMKRVARNADLLASRLYDCGWKPLSPKITPLRTKPAQGDEEVFSHFEKLTGAPVPPTLLAFWKIVGGINFVWDYLTYCEPAEPVPDLGVALPMAEMDPLSVDPPSAFNFEFKQWQIHEDNGSFRIDLAPDFLLHKTNVSSRTPFVINPSAILVPVEAADPVFVDKRHALPFLDYLRLAFKWAGFPGLEDYAERPDVQRFVEKFGQGLQPF
jgi:hypothetical protein